MTEDIESVLVSSRWKISIDQDGPTELRKRQALPSRGAYLGCIMIYDVLFKAAFNCNMIQGHSSSLGKGREDMEDLRDWGGGKEGLDTVSDLF